MKELIITKLVKIGNTFAQKIKRIKAIINPPVTIKPISTVDYTLFKQR